jgi:hypothetical protein
VSVRFATFNVENFFARPKVFSLPDWADGQPVLDAFAEFNTLIEKPAYAAADKPAWLSCWSSWRSTARSAA